MRISDWSSDVCSSDLRAWATRPPQKAPRPVTRTRLPMPLPEPDRLTVAQHVVERLLDQLTYQLRLVHYQAPRVPRPIGLHVEGDGEIGRESCRECVYQYVSNSVVAVTLRKNIT